MIIETKCPTRIDLAGGLLDLWPIHAILENSMTVNIGIDLYSKTTLEQRDGNKIYVKSIGNKTEFEFKSIEELTSEKSLTLVSEAVSFFKPEGGISITTECKAPKSAGLGGSSSLLISLCGALNEYTGKKYTDEKLLRTVYGIETKMIKMITGTQDHIGAMYGGINLIHYTINGEVIEKPKHKGLNENLANQLVLCYTGETRFSGSNNWRILQKLINKEEKTERLLSGIRDATLKMASALRDNKLEMIAEALGQDWENRKKLARGVTTKGVEKAIKIATKAGAYSAKACGAGGGGCIVFYTGNNKPKVEEALRQNNIEVLDFKIAEKGIDIVRVG